MPTATEMAVTMRLKETFNKEFHNCFHAAVALWNSRKPAYDTELPIWHRMPFGEKSFIHEIFQKAGRLVAMANAPTAAGDMGEELLDIINYCAALYAYKRLDLVVAEEVPIRGRVVSDVDHEPEF